MLIVSIILQGSDGIEENMIIVYVNLLKRYGKYQDK